MEVSTWNSRESEDCSIEIPEFGFNTWNISRIPLCTHGGPFSKTLGPLVNGQTGLSQVAQKKTPYTRTASSFTLEIHPPKDNNLLVSTADQCHTGSLIKTSIRFFLCSIVSKLPNSFLSSLFMRMTG